jgi:uncharacterized protein YidB (DUF937 family)
MGLQDTFGDGGQLVDELTAHLRVNGLQSLLAGFDGAGAERAVESWVGDGPNLSVEPGDVKRAFGRDEIEAMAGRLGSSADDVAAGLARVIPAAVDAITPGGTLPSGADLDVLDFRRELAGTDIAALLA